MYYILQNTLRNLQIFQHNEQLDDSTSLNYILTAAQRDGICDILRNSRTNIPAKASILPTDIKYFKMFKAAKQKTILELYRIPLLYSQLLDEALSNLYDLHDLQTASIQYSLSPSEINNIDRLAKSFVRGYKALYYRQDLQRLSIYLINVYMLLHLTQYIRVNGPTRYQQSFPLERYIYKVKKMARSKSYIGTLVANIVTRNEQLNVVLLLNRRRRDYSTNYLLPCNNLNIRRYLRQRQYIENVPLSYQLLRRLDISLTNQISYFTRYKLSEDITISLRLS